MPNPKNPDKNVIVNANQNNDNNDNNDNNTPAGPLNATPQQPPNQMPNQPAPQQLPNQPNQPPPNQSAPWQPLLNNLFHNSPLHTNLPQQIPLVPSSLFQTGNKLFHINQSLR